jgi:hypothetical protein
MECRGLNARLSTKGGLITISQTFPPGKVEIPLYDVVAVELVVSSIFPPIALSLVGFVILVAIWWIAGGWTWPVVLAEPYRSSSSWAVLGSVSGLAGAGYVWLFAKIKITTLNSDTKVTIQMVPKHSGGRFVSNIRSMIRSIEE